MKYKYNFILTYPVIGLMSPLSYFSHIIALMTLRDSNRNTSDVCLTRQSLLWVLSILNKQSLFPGIVFDSLWNMQWHFLILNAPFKVTNNTSVRSHTVITDAMYLLYDKIAFETLCMYTHVCDNKIYNMNYMYM